MTDMVTGTPGQDTPSVPVETSQPVQQSAAPAREERTFKQHDVDAIVQREKAKAVESYRRLQTEQPEYFQQKYGEAPKPAQTQTQSSNPLTAEQEIRRLAAEEAQRHFDKINQDLKSKYDAEQAQKTVNNFWNKISTGKDKYQDFQEMTGDIQYASFPNVVQILAEHVENSDEMLYELGKDRTKLAVLEQLAQMSPQDAIKQARRMSQAIKDNAAASKVRVPNEPLSQMRPSTTGTDNGVMSVRDYRKRWKV